jgi:transposase
VDECGFNLGAVPFYARSHKSKRAVIKRPGKRGSNYTLTLCVKNVKEKAVISYKLIKGGSKTKDFHKFLSKIKFTTHLLLDNARIHHATNSCRKLKLSTIAELARKKKIKLVYLPGYSPKLNPVEKCFSMIKNYYRQQRPRTERKLRKVIKEAIAKLQQQDLTKTFKSCFGL